jgi:hypothetical protein
MKHRAKARASYLLRVVFRPPLAQQSRPASALKHHTCKNWHELLYRLKKLYGDPKHFLDI